MANHAASIAPKLLKWYDRQRRPLPWRSNPGQPPHPYRVLVSEFMLQQTQVATVVPYFLRFIEEFPTLSALAAAPEQDVLRLWQGLGYYSRARNLRAAAAEIVARFAGEIPPDVESLLQLPGIGRYTAGAVASIAFDQRAPIVDGNVARVLSRIYKIIKPDTNLLWRNAEAILPSRRAGDFNSALMELGATVCTPRQPLCCACPLQRICLAFAAGVQETIPAPRKKKPTPLVARWTFAIRRRGKWLIEQRPPKGRWAGLWQFITVEAAGTSPNVHGPTRRLGQIEHQLSHRKYRFTVFTCAGLKNAADVAPRRWVSLQELDRYPMSTPQLRIAQLIQETKL